jgi:hypothetical protein
MTIAMPIVIQYLIAWLFLWSLLSMGAAVFGLNARAQEFWRSFWFMTGMWGMVDGGIAWYALLRPALDPTALVPILFFNAGLDGLYIAMGGILVTRASARLRGFGLAILIQGFFLLGFDLYFGIRCGFK